MDSDLVVALRSRDVTVFTPLDFALTENSDEAQLAFAMERGCVLYTHNTCDFCRIHTEWVNTRREHAGIIVAAQQRFSVGEQLRRILHIRANLSAEHMRNRLEFLSSWG